MINKAKTLSTTYREQLIKLETGVTTLSFGIYNNDKVDAISNWISLNFVRLMTVK